LSFIEIIELLIDLIIFSRKMYTFWTFWYLKFLKFCIWSTKKESRAVKKNIRFGLTLVLFVVILVAACIIAPITVYFGNLTSTTAPKTQDTSISIFHCFLY
jgi:membrane protease YdiL (CAAX protease family)